MKKLLVVLLAVVMALALFACGEKPAGPTPDDPTPVDPTPVDPTPVDPTPVDPTPVDPTPVDPTPVDPTPGDLTEEQVLLMATNTTDSRANGQRIGTCPSPEHIAVIRDGGAVAEANLELLQYDGEPIPAVLVGGPAIICKDAAGVVKAVKPIEGKMLETSQYRFSRDEEGNYLHDGQPINIDVEKLGDESSFHTFYKPQSLYFNTINIITNPVWNLDSNCDDYLTLWDADNDGAYDFARLIPVVNGGKILAISDKTIQVFGGFGSPFSMYTWNNGTNTVQYEWINEEAKTDLKIGDYISFYYQFDSTVTTKAMNSFLAKMVIVEKSYSATEVLESAEGSDLDITCVFGGKTYQWSDAMFNSDGDGLFDGIGGSNAGRTLMVESNFGTELTYACDRSGKIVYAEFPPDYTRNDVILYATFTRNLRVTGTSNLFLPKEGQIAVVLDGATVNDASAFKLDYFGDNVDDLVGLPVTLVKDDEGNVIDIKLRGKKVEFISGNAVLAGSSEIRVGRDRYAIDADRWGDKTYGQNSYALNNGQYVANLKTNNTRWGIASNTDEIITLVDRDEDGIYDFMRVYEIWNAISVPLVLDDQIILGDVVPDGDKQYIYGSFGSSGNTGWIDGQKSWYFTTAPGVEMPDFADDLYVNGVLFLNGASDTVPTGKLGAEFYVTSICEKKTGVFTDMVYNSITDISCKVDGKAMKWSDNWANYDYADGKADEAAGLEAGHRAGRNLMKAENNGKTFNYWCDEVGNIVRVQLVEG